MLIRSLTLTLLLAIAGPLFAADNDSPIAGDMGRARPLIVIAQSTVDPVWVGKKSLEDPANKKGVTDRNIKVYTILNMAGQLDGKDLGHRTPWRCCSLKLGAGAYQGVPAGQGRRDQTSASGDEAKSVDLKKSSTPSMRCRPAKRKSAHRRSLKPRPPPPNRQPRKREKGAKASKPAKPSKPPEMPDD
jgi:hypothetical protein